VDVAHHWSNGEPDRMIGVPTFMLSSRVADQITLDELAAVVPAKRPKSVESPSERPEA